MAIMKENCCSLQASTSCARCRPPAPPVKNGSCFKWRRQLGSLSPQLSSKEENRSLHEILQDPKTEWAEIRDAIKTQGRACTNLSLLRVLNSGNKSISVNDSERSFPLKKKQPLDPKIDEAVGDGGSSSLNLMRRLSRRLSHKSSRSFQRRRSSFCSIGSVRSMLSLVEDDLHSLSSSVNLMDFGVDPNDLMRVQDDDEIMPEGRDISRIESLNSFAITSDGFMDWKRDESSTTLNSKNYTSPDEPDNCLDDAADEFGFLGWSQNGDHEEKGDHPDCLHHRRLSSQSWNIEDYEDPDDMLSRCGNDERQKETNFCPGQFLSIHIKRLSTLSDKSSRDSMKKHENGVFFWNMKPKPKQSSGMDDDVRTFDVKKALLNFKKSLDEENAHLSHSKPKTFSRRGHASSNHDYYRQHGEAISASDHQISPGKRFRQKEYTHRRSLIDVPHFLKSGKRNNPKAPSRKTFVSNSDYATIWINNREEDCDENIDQLYRRLYCKTAPTESIHDDDTATPKDWRRSTMAFRASSFGGFVTDSTDIL